MRNLPPAISFPKDQQLWFMHPYPWCATVSYTITMYGHRQPQGGEIFINPLQLRARPLLLPLFEKTLKNQLSSHRGGTRWQAFGGLGSWRAELELCAALSDLQSQFDWFKAPVHPPSSFSSPSNSPHGGFLSCLNGGPFRRCTRVAKMWHLNCSLQ